MSNIKAIKEKVKDLKVLFVDDEKDIRDGMGTFLRKLFHDVSVCADGLEGLNTFEKNQDIDIILTDILMPKMSGIEMIEQIRVIKPHVFVIYITASRRDYELKDNEKHVYLKKPVSYDEILGILDSIGTDV